jgi:signal transduction histidine kinase
MRIWEEGVRGAATPPLRADRLVLQNSFPTMLASLAAALEAGNPAYRQTGASAHHGRERAARSYTVTQVLFEFNWLRRVLFAVLDERFSLSIDSRNVILGAIEAELTEAMAAFVNARAATDLRAREEAAAATEDLKGQLKSLEVDRELKERFVASLSHDLRNPVGAAMMAASLLADEIGDAPVARDMFKLLSSNLNRTRRMLDDLLDVGRVSAGHPLHLDLQDTSLFEIAMGTAADLEIVHGKVFRIAGAGSVRGNWDPSYLRRAVENLLVNAVKYGARNGSITVTVLTQEDGASIAVHNQGEPIPPSERENLFKPFHRAQGVSERGVVGWGLGLALVRAVAEAHGGTVSVESDRAHGTTFTMSLPRGTQLH